MASELHFRLDMAREEALDYYQGAIRFIIVTADNGQRIQFPAENLRPFIEQDGVHGYFSLLFDHNNKLLSLKRI
ncbi:MAG: DUF2835 domain-containing protein [Methylophagaceae bacterium]